MHPRDNAEVLRDSWQGRCLAGTEGMAFCCVLSVLAHNFDESMLPLLHAVFPGFYSISAPFLTTAARIQHHGQITANVFRPDGVIVKDFVLFDDEIDMRDRFRGLADKLALTDAERIEMFECIRKWVVCDYRLDPFMDPRDPDAKRLVN